MNKERQKKGKVEEFVNNKVTRATAAIALTLAAGAAVEKGLGYDVLPHVERAEADGPNLLPNSSFLNPSPSDWSKIFLPDANNLDTYDSSGGRLDTNSVISRLKSISCPDLTNNGWEVSDPVVVDVNKKYEFKYWSKYLLNSSNTTSEPDALVEFFDASGVQIDSYAPSKPHTLGQNTWESFGLTIGPALSGADKVYPPLTAKVKVGFVANGTTTDPCVPGTTYVTEIFDDVSLTEITQTAVGGVAEVPDLSKLPALSATGQDDSKEIPVLIGGIVVGALVVGAGGYAVRSIKRQKSA